MRSKKLESTRKQISIKIKQIRYRKAILLIFFLVILLFLLPFFLKGKAVRSFYIGNVNLGLLKSSESREIIGKVLEKYHDSKATFVLDDHIIETKISDLGVELDPDATFNQLYIIGESGNYLNDLRQYYTSYFKEREIKPFYSLDISKFTDFVNREFSGFEKQPVNAKFSIEKGETMVVSSVSGEVLDLSKIVSDFATGVDNLSQTPVEIETISAFPNINTSELNLIADKYNNLKSRKITLFWNYDSWKLEGESLISMLKIDRSGTINDYLLSLEGGRSSISLKNIKFADSVSPNVEILVDNQKLDVFLNSIARTVNRQAVNATAKFDGNIITNFTPAIDGQKVNIEEAKTQILSNISINNTADKSDINIKLPVAVTTARIVNERINSLGIFELIGKGVSYFTGSIANRIFNIELGAGRVNGTLIAPGEIFSFNNTVGEVSDKTGYKQAYVISKGRTVLDDGGGICQVSTTVFRAALSSGLPIVTRTAHAYRVGYYEQRGFGPGLDATVFAPSVDFKFRNDTGRHILVQTVFNRANAMLEVDIYGTRDSRIVELGKPVILNRTPAPPEIRQDDASLPKGTTKQVDFAAEGANVYFTRKVYRGGQLLYDDTFKSNFKPWQAIFLVGTGG